MDAYLDVLVGRAGRDELLCRSRLCTAAAGVAPELASDPAALR